LLYVVDFVLLLYDIADVDVMFIVDNLLT